jgi:hypothetical protein
MGIMEIKISDYCKACAFLCKTDKEYCPNHMDPAETLFTYKKARDKSPGFFISLIELNPRK